MADLPDEPQARQPSDLQRLVAACGVPNALSRLRRLERRHFLFVQKACTEFADALEASVAVSTFHDAGQANAGMAPALQINPPPRLVSIFSTQKSLLRDNL